MRDQTVTVDQVRYALADAVHAVSRDPAGTSLWEEFWRTLLAFGEPERRGYVQVPEWPYEDVSMPRVIPLEVDELSRVLERLRQVEEELGHIRIGVRAATAVMEHVAMDAFGTAQEAE